jgi:proteasome accessory factor A
MADPLGALREISRDTSLRRDLRLAQGAASNAIDIQRAYLALARRVCDLSSPDKRALADEWEHTLNDLATDPLLCRDRLDWVAKRALIEEFQLAQDLTPDDPWLRSLDLEYHRLDPAEGLYYGLEQSGAMLRVEGDAETDAAEAVLQPPASTRALIRGQCVQRFPGQIIAAQWDRILLQGSRGPIALDLNDLFDPDAISQVGAALTQARHPDELIASALSGSFPSLAAILETYA